MFYFLLRPIVSASLWLFHKRIAADGINDLDKSPRALLILANHSVSFMDAFLLACHLRRRIYFFARGDAFQNAFFARLLLSLGVLPIFRKTEGAENLNRNQNSNEAALDIFRKGGALLIFCEGTSDIQKQLKPLKKGPFRLALEAAAQLDEAPLIQPLGINYSSPTAPGGIVYLVPGAPMELEQPVRNQSSAARAKAATTLMRRLELALQQIVWHMPQQADFETANAVMASLSLLDEEVQFPQTRQLLDEIQSGSPARKPALQHLMQKLQQIRKRPFTFSERSTLVVAAPVALWGFVFHVIPLSCAAFLTKKFVHAADFWAPVFLCSTLLILGFWYLLLWGILLLVWPFLYGICLLLLSAACGIFFIKKYKPLWQRRLQIDRAISRLEALKNQ